MSEADGTVDHFAGAVRASMAQLSDHGCELGRFGPS
jgi:hypothetical protein